MLFLIFYVIAGVYSRRVCSPTPADIIGPYYYAKAPRLQQFCTGDEKHNRLKTLLIHGKVYKQDCRTPLPFVNMEIWQADHRGQYKMDALCRGRFKTDKYGYYEISTIHPGRYALDNNDMYRPAHLHFRVHGRRGHKGLITQMYFLGDPFLGRNDSCDVCSSGKRQLVIRPRNFCSKRNASDCIQVAKFNIVLERGSGMNIIGGFYENRL